MVDFGAIRRKGFAAPCRPLVECTSWTRLALDTSFTTTWAHSSPRWNNLIGLSDAASRYSSEAIPRGEGVVSTANYEAGPPGCHSAMPTSTVVRLWPQAAIVRPKMKLHAEILRQILAVVESCTPLIEPMLIDEAFLDVTGPTRLVGPPEAHAFENRTAGSAPPAADLGFGTCRTNMGRGTAPWGRSPFTARLDRSPFSGLSMYARTRHCAALDGSLRAESDAGSRRDGIVVTSPHVQLWARLSHGVYDSQGRRVEGLEPSTSTFAT